MREQNANVFASTKRASRPAPVQQQRYIDDDDDEYEDVPANPHRSGHSSGIHPEDAPRTTNTQAPQPLMVSQRTPTTTQSQIPAQWPYDDNSAFQGYNNLQRHQNLPVRYSRQSKAVTKYQQPSSIPARRTAQHSHMDVYEEEPRQQPRRRKQKREYHWLVYVGIALVLIVLGGFLFPILKDKTDDVLDNMHYGTPRRSTDTVDLGYGTKSDIIVQNNGGEIDLTESHRAGGKMYVKGYIVASFSGDKADKYPPTIIESRGNGRINIIIIVHDTQYKFVNDGKQLTPLKMG